MHVLNSLLILASLVDISAAKCFTGGQQWMNENDKNRARGAATDLCWTYNLAGWFENRQTKRHCAYVSNNIKVDFTVQWLGAGGHTLNAEDCVKRLHDEINNCFYGGYSTVADWYFV